MLINSAKTNYTLNKTQTYNDNVKVEVKMIRKCHCQHLLLRHAIESVTFLTNGKHVSHQFLFHIFLLPLSHVLARFVTSPTQRSN